MCATACHDAKLPKKRRHLLEYKGRSLTTRPEEGLPTLETSQPPQTLAKRPSPKTASKSGLAAQAPLSCRRENSVTLASSPDVLNDKYV
jgi:hypothetical protein